MKINKAKKMCGFEHVEENLVTATSNLSFVLCAIRAGEDISPGICPFFVLAGALNCSNPLHITSAT
jgi:hypothetical protein